MSNFQFCPSFACFALSETPEISFPSLQHLCALSCLKCFLSVVSVFSVYSLRFWWQKHDLCRDFSPVGFFIWAGACILTLTAEYNDLSRLKIHLQQDFGRLVRKLTSYNELQDKSVLVKFLQVLTFLARFFQDLHFLQVINKNKQDVYDLDESWNKSFVCKNLVGNCENKTFRCEILWEFCNKYNFHNQGHRTFKLVGEKKPSLFSPLFKVKSFTVSGPIQE